MSKIYSAFLPGAVPPKCCNDQLTWVFQIALLQIAARSIHHIAVMLAGTLRSHRKITALGKRTRSTSSRSIATIDTCRLTFIIGDESVKNEAASRANPIAKQAWE